ncbi:hypothetical protein MNBD_UNCLBAC01-580 [hydrothermal vent metagenome]|uniref:Uncharacterized protein n=1 Tax=hydrothermal vent metagenome TaxID=652676 RepID=A0A3B1DZT1_9ZZZZ
MLLLLLAAYGYGVFTIQYAEEKVHFIQYGVLSFFAYRALRLDLPHLWAYFAALILSSFIGWGDEGIQHLLPNRYYQTSDVFLNIFSVGLGLFFIFILEREM